MGHYFSKVSHTGVLLEGGVLIEGGVILERIRYKLIYSCDFATLTRYNSRQTRVHAKIFSDLDSVRCEESFGMWFGQFRIPPGKCS